MEKEIYKDVIGKVCIVRSHDAGVYYGTVTAIDGTTVSVENVRNIWRWNGATCLSQIANDGIRSGDVSQVVKSMILLCVCQIIPLTENALNSLNSIEEWKC